MKGDLWAGITVGLMVSPQGLAYAAMAGMPLVRGIYVSLLPALAALKRLDTVGESNSQAVPRRESARRG